MNKANYLLKNMGILTISNFASKILIFLLVPLYTAVLTTEEYGSYDLAVSTATLLYPILSLNIVDAVMRFSMDKNYSKNAVATIGMKYLSISVLLFAVGMFVLNRLALWPDVYGLEFYIFLYYMSYAFNQFLIQFTKGIERVKDMGVAGVIATLVTLVTNVLFLLVFKWGLSGFFIANILAQALSAVFLAFRVKIWVYLKSFKIDRELSREMLEYSVPLIATAVGWWVNSTADKYVVAFMIGVSANGLISVSYKIPQIINAVQGIFIQAWQISAIKEYGDNDTKKFYGKTFLVINCLMCLICALLIILTKPLAHIMFANDFYTAWEYVPFLLIASVFNCASGVLGPILSAQKNSKAMMWSALIGAGANIVLNIWFVYLIGIQGATIATVICSYIIYIVRKVAVGKEIIIDHYYRVICSWILLCVQACFEIYTRMWWVELCIILSVVLLNMSSIKMISKSIVSMIERVRIKN